MVIFGLSVRITWEIDRLEYVLHAVFCMIFNGASELVVVQFGYISFTLVRRKSVWRLRLETYGGELVCEIICVWPASFDRNTCIFICQFVWRRSKYNYINAFRNAWVYSWSHVVMCDYFNGFFANNLKVFIKTRKMW